MTYTSHILAVKLVTDACIRTDYLYHIPLDPALC